MHKVRHMNVAVMVALLALLTRSFVGTVCHLSLPEAATASPALSGVVICTANGERASPTGSEGPLPVDHDTAAPCFICLSSHDGAIDRPRTAEASGIAFELAQPLVRQSDHVAWPFARGSARTRAPPSLA